MGKLHKSLKYVRNFVFVLFFALTQAVTSVGPFIQSQVASATNTPPGNNGTLKVHEKGTPSDSESNDPKVCIFNFEGFGLDPNQTGNITIETQSGTPVITPVTISLATDGSGNGETDYINDTGSILTLANGHYKATLDNKFGTDPGDKAKSKVFKVECEEAELGSIKVSKKVDADGDGEFEGGNPAANNLGFKWGLDDETPARNMGTQADEVAVGEHEVTENDVTGYKFVGWYYTYKTYVNDCNNPVGDELPAQFEVKADKTTYITLCNKKVEEAKGSITIIKDTVPNHHRDFPFTTTGEGLSNFTLDDDDDPTLSNTKTFSDLVAGSYSVTESPVTSWYVYKIDCGQATGVQIDGSTVNITLAAGQHVTCTFVNKHQTGSVQVIKKVDSGDGYQTVGENSPFKWGLDNGEVNRNMGSTQSGVPVGSHTVTENANGVDGYELAGWFVGDGNCTNYRNSKTLPVSVSVRTGQTTKVTFCNKQVSDSKISGYKFHDINGNGVKDGIFEPKIANWRIYLYEGDSETPIDWVDTSSSLAQYGSYRFTGLPAGDYRVCEANPIGWQQIVPNPLVDDGCYPVTLDGTNHVSDIIFGNRAVADVTVIKNVDKNNDGDTEDYGDEQNSNKWTWNYYSLLGSKSSITTGSTVTVPVGSLGAHYLLSENQRDGYDLQDVDCNVHFYRLGDYVKVFAQAGSNIVCTFTNVKKPELTVIKKASPRDGTDFCFSLERDYGPRDHSYNAEVSPLLNLYEDYDQPECSFTLDDGYDDDNYTNKHSQYLKPGTYTITEQQLHGWRLDDIHCWGAEVYRTDNAVTLEIGYGDKVVCKFVNVKLGKVIVTKFNDYNRNGYQDENEPALPDWNINLKTQDECEEDYDTVASFSSNYNEGCEEDYSYDRTKTTDENGQVKFYGVKPDQTHVLSEELQEGWNWSNTYCHYYENGEGQAYDENYYKLYVEAGYPPLECYIGNYQDPNLVIEKSNDRPEPTAVGDTVTYTIKVTVPENSGAIFDAVVRDLPPAGFTYVPGSWTSTSPETTDPLFNPLGVWELGDLFPGDVVTLTYKATIDDSVSPGTYTNVAYLEGCEYELRQYNPELDRVNTDSYQEYPEEECKDPYHTPFVESDVTVEAPQVLGASTTKLVETGITDLWRNLVFSTSLMAAALVTVLRRRKQEASL